MDHECTPNSYPTLEQAYYKSKNAGPQVLWEDSHVHRAFIFHIGPTTIVVPYSVLGEPTTHVVDVRVPSYFADAEALYGRNKPAEKKTETKPQEKTDLCSTHIYTRK